MSNVFTAQLGKMCHISTGDTATTILNPRLLLLLIAALFLAMAVLVTERQPKHTTKQHEAIASMQNVVASNELEMK